MANATQPTVHLRTDDLQEYNYRGILLGKLPLPYPLSIGRVQAGNWSSSVREELIFEGRIGVAMGEASDVRVAHMPDEHIDAQDVVSAARTYILAALRFLV